MIETILQGWDGARHVLDTMPPWLAAFLLGWLTSVAVTQMVKFLLPRGWWAELREDLTRFVAFMAAALPALFYVGQAGYGSLGMLLQAVITGVWAPLAYALLVAWLRRRPGLAWIADVLSGDVRGVIAAKLKGEDP